MTTFTDRWLRAQTASAGRLLRSRTAPDERDARWASGSDDGRTGLTMVIRRPWEAKKLPPASDASNALEPGVPDSTDLIERDYGALRTAGRVEALRLCQLTDSCSLLARNA